MKKSVADDLLFLQMRLFHLFQYQEGITVEKAEKVFKEYKVFEYIKTCYEEFHVQGDDADLQDISSYLSINGWQK